LHEGTLCCAFGRQRKTEKTPRRSPQVILNLTKGGKGKEGKVGLWKVESRDELQGDFIKGGKGTLLNGVTTQGKG
jgi:hypothetical protein